MRNLKKIMQAFSPFANRHEKEIQTYLKSLTEKSNQTQTIKHLLNFIQKDFASVNLWTEYKYKGYAYLDKQTRITLYHNLTLIEDEFEKYYKNYDISNRQNYLNDYLNVDAKNDIKLEKLTLMTCIMDYFSINRGLYIYQESSSFGKLLQDPVKDNLVGDCNQIVSLYIHIYARYNPITDLKLRTIPGHVALHFDGQDIEATKGEFADYSNHKDNKILPIYEIVSINLLDVTDAYLKTKPINPKDLLQAARLAYLLSNNREVVTHNLNASYGTLINMLVKSNDYNRALILARQSGDNKYLELVGHNAAIYYINNHDFNKAKQFAELTKDSQSLKKDIWKAEGAYYYNKGNYDLAIKAFSQINNQESIKKCYEALYIREQNKLPKNLNSNNIKNYRKIIHSMKVYAKKSNNKTLQDNVNQYTKYF